MCEQVRVEGGVVRTGEVAERRVLKASHLKFDRYMRAIPEHHKTRSKLTIK